jgi:FAD/FMN-containing dehydrogenase
VPGRGRAGDRPRRGTSIAGNAVGTGVVLDFSRHMGRVLAVDPDAATATVQPGVVQEDLQRAAAPHGLRFGPDPSSSSRCTIGGMIGNNACGTRALGYGRTSDNLLGLRAITGSGAAWNAPAVRDGLSAVARAGLGTIRTEFGRFGRQVSGFALENLLPEQGFGVHRLLAGSEGTLAVITEATVRLVSEPAHRVLVVLGYPDIAAAGDATPAVLTHGPVACEGIDSRIVDVVRDRRGPPCRRCREVRPGSSSNSPATTRPSCRCVRRSSETVVVQWIPWWSWTPVGPASCGGSGPTAPGWAAARRVCPPTPGWEDAAVPRNEWATICATSTP